MQYLTLHLVLINIEVAHIQARARSAYHPTHQILPQSPRPPFYLCSWLPQRVVASLMQYLTFHLVVKGKKSWHDNRGILCTCLSKIDSSCSLSLSRSVSSICATFSIAAVRRGLPKRICPGCLSLFDGRVVMRRPGMICNFGGMLDRVLVGGTKEGSWKIASLVLFDSYIQASMPITAEERAAMATSVDFFADDKDNGAHVSLSKSREALLNYIQANTSSSTTRPPPQTVRQPIQRARRFGSPARAKSSSGAEPDNAEDSDSESVDLEWRMAIRRRAEVVAIRRLARNVLTVTQWLATNTPSA
ncbi:hypothetical protein JOM56_013064 [Amanita muscaria]